MLDRGVFILYTEGMRTPAQYVIEIFGGAREIARLLDKDPSTVYKWVKPRSLGGTDGAIPTHEQRLLLGLAVDRGLDLTAEDLILGRAAEEPAAV